MVRCGWELAGVSGAYGVEEASAFALGGAPVGPAVPCHRGRQADDLADPAGRYGQGAQAMQPSGNLSPLELSELCLSGGDPS